MACYFKALDTAASSIASFLFQPGFSSKVGSLTGFKRRESQQLVCSVLFVMISLVAVVTTWFIHAYFSSLGVYGTLGKYELTLPQISYTGADPPAYYIFCTCIPLGCLMMRYPIATFLREFESAVHNDPAFALPRASFCHCFWCCCCCCFDCGRLRLEKKCEEEDDNNAGGAVAGAHMAPPHTTAPRRSQDESSTISTWVRLAPAFTPCSPYLPYVVRALIPLWEIAVHSLALLSIVSVGHPDPFPAIHGMFAFYFFYSMIALHSCWWFVQWSSVQSVWGSDACRSSLGFELDSKRFRAHSRIVAIELFVMFGVNWLLFFVASMYGANTGRYGFYNFMISYISAISQWVLVALIACSALAFGQDIEYWPHPLSSSETPPIIAKHSVTAADGGGADAIEEGKLLSVVANAKGSQQQQQLQGQQQQCSTELALASVEASQQQQHQSTRKLTPATPNAGVAGSPF